jgi:hypothetical protein
VNGFDLDVRLKDGPRFKQQAGTLDRRTLNELRTMLRALWKVPQHQRLVHELHVGKRALWDVYLAYREGRLKDVAPVTAKEEDPELQGLLDMWFAELQVSESHKDRLRRAFKALRNGRKPHRSDLPTLLEEYRSRCVKENHPRSFNYAKAGCLALLRDTLGRRSELYLTIADVAKMPEDPHGAKALPVEEARAIRQRLVAAGQDHAAAIWWAMCCTGMGATEYWGEWEVLADRVRIRGTKRPGRRWGSQGREVPLIATPVAPEITPDRFARVLRTAKASPYQGRHSYGTWLEDAEIPRTRRKLYLGHAAGDVTDRYERREITRFLEEDRARLVKVLGVEPTLAITKTMGLLPLREWQPAVAGG